MEDLKDIKGGFVEPPDASFLYLMLTIFGTVALLIGLFFLFKWLSKPKRKRKRLTAKERAIVNLKEMSFDNTKEAVYTFSENIQIVASNDEVKNFLEELEKYKFRKEVPTLSDDDREKMKKFIEEFTGV